MAVFHYMKEDKTRNVITVIRPRLAEASAEQPHMKRNKHRLKRMQRSATTVVTTLADLSDKEY